VDGQRQEGAAAGGMLTSRHFGQGDGDVRARGVGQKRFWALRLRACGIAGKRTEATATPANSIIAPHRDHDHRASTMV